MRRRWWIASSSALLLVALLVSQLNGDFGAWLADVSRTVLGAQRTAQIESWFLTAEDDLHQVQYHLLGQRVTAPWRLSATTPRDQGSHTLRVMPLPAMTPLVQPAVLGEGIWTTDGLPLPAAGQPPFAAKAFLHPDPVRPYAVVTMLQFDLRAVALHLVSGTSEPGGTLGYSGSGAVLATDRQGDTLVAAFNGGFKYADGHYGLMADGVVYVPPVAGAATLAITRQGQVILGAWGSDPRLSLANTGLIAWRQNGALLLDHGRLNPLTSDGAAWGGVYLKPGLHLALCHWADRSRHADLRRGRLALGGDIGQGVASRGGRYGDADGHQSQMGARLHLSTLNDGDLADRQAGSWDARHRH